MKKNTLSWALMMAIALPAIATEEALPTVKVKAKLSNVDTVVAK